MMYCLSGVPSRAAMVALTSLRAGLISADEPNVAELIAFDRLLAAIFARLNERVERCSDSCALLTLSFCSSLDLKLRNSITVKLSSVQSRSTSKICTVPVQIGAYCGGVPPGFNSLRTVPCTLMQVAIQQIQMTL